MDYLLIAIMFLLLVDIFLLTHIRNELRQVKKLLKEKQEPNLQPGEIVYGDYPAFLKRQAD